MVKKDKLLGRLKLQEYITIVSLNLIYEVDEIPIRDISSESLYKLIVDICERFIASHEKNYKGQEIIDQLRTFSKSEVIEFYKKNLH